MVEGVEMLLIEDQLCQHVIETSTHYRRRQYYDIIIITIIMMLHVIIPASVCECETVQ